MAIFERPDHSGVEIVGRRRIDVAMARRIKIKQMVIMRSAGCTDAEIGRVFGHKRETVNRFINGVPAHVRDRLRDIGLA